MDRDPDDHPLKRLESALLVAPSPAASARVRERVRQESARASHGWWSLAAASVALLAVGIASATALSTMWRRAPTPPAAVVATNRSTPVDAVVPAVPGATPALVSPKRARTAPQPATARPAVVLAPGRSREPEVLVPPDEGIALRRLLIALRQGRATVPAAGLRVAEDAEGHLLEPRPIDIPSIKIELLPGTPVVVSGGTVK